MQLDASSAPTGATLPGADSWPALRAPSSTSAAERPSPPPYPSSTPTHRPSEPPSLTSSSAWSRACEGVSPLLGTRRGARTAAHTRVRSHPSSHTHGCSSSGGKPRPPQPCPLTGSPVLLQHVCVCHSHMDAHSHYRYLQLSV